MLAPWHGWAEAVAQRGRYAVRASEVLFDLDGLSAEGAGSTGGPYAGLDIGAFSAETTEYAAMVPHGTTHARLVPTTADEDLTLRAGTGSELTRVSSGETGPALALAVSDNVVVVRTGTDMEKTYAVTATRAARVSSSDADLAGLTAEAGTDGDWTALDIETFSAATTDCAAAVPHGPTTHARLTATAADPDATLKAGAGSSLSALSSGAATAAVPLEVAQTRCRWR